MGRPVNSRKFGNPATTDGNQFYMMADVGAGVEQCFIVNQKGTKLFTVEAVSNGTQARVRMVDTPSDVTGIGFGYIEAGGAGSNKEAETATVAGEGAGYSVTDTVTLAGATTGTAATYDVVRVMPVSGDEAIHATWTGGDGVGGTAYAPGDTITMSDGSVVTVDAVDGNDDVTEFTLINTLSIGVAADTATLTQSATDGTGTLFDITLAVADQGIYSVTVNVTGSMTAVDTNPVATTGGTGTGATLNVLYSSIDDEYVAKLSNKNLIVVGGQRRETYTINADGSADRDVSGA